MDIISAVRETFGQPFGEFRGTIDFGGVGLCRNEDPTFLSGTVRRQDSALLGVGHGVGTPGVPALSFSISDIGMIPRQYNDGRTGDQSGETDEHDQPDG